TSEMTTLAASGPLRSSQRGAAAGTRSGWVDTGELWCRSNLSFGAIPTRSFPGPPVPPARSVVDSRPVSRFGGQQNVTLPRLAAVDRSIALECGHGSVEGESYGSLQEQDAAAVCDGDGRYRTAHRPRRRPGPGHDRG